MDTVIIWRMINFYKIFIKIVYDLFILYVDMTYIICTNKSKTNLNYII